MPSFASVPAYVSLIPPPSLNGGLSPLTGFMNEDVYNKVVEEYHLPSGEVFGLPIVMDTDDASVTVGTSCCSRTRAATWR